MSNRDPRQRFDYQNWLNGQVAERAKASLTARDAAFAENNAGVTRAALQQDAWRQRPRGHQHTRHDLAEGCDSGGLL